MSPSRLWALTPPPSRRAQQQRRQDAEARRRRRFWLPEVEKRRQIQILQARQQRKRRQEAVLPLTPPPSSSFLSAHLLSLHSKNFFMPCTSSFFLQRCIEVFCICKHLWILCSHWGKLYLSKPELNLINSNQLKSLSWTFRYWPGSERTTKMS